MKVPTVAMLTKIVEIQAAITADLSVSRVMQIVTESTQELTGATGAVVEIADGDDMVYRAGSGSAAPHVGVRLKMGTSLSGLCVKTGKVLRCDDSEEDGRVDREACRRIGLRSMLVVPLRRGSESIGVLKVLSDMPAAFSDDDEHLLELMAGFIASAMHNASAYEQSLLHALHDGLTGLPNRRLFRDRVSYQLAQLQRKEGLLAVSYIDLDGFKEVNDRHGHKAGDELLVAVAERMQRDLRQADTVARLGGDEFAVLIVGLGSRGDADIAAERIRSRIEDHPFHLTAGRAKVGASVGIALGDGKDGSTDDLLDEADRAMYAAKRSRKGAGTALGSRGHHPPADPRHQAEA